MPNRKEIVMLRRIAPLLLLALGALACSLTGSRAPTNAPDALATSGAATLTALAPQAASATPSAAPAASSTPAAAASAASAVPATAAVTVAATTEVSATAAATVAVAAGCKLAYADQGTLYCLPDSGTPQTLATGSGLFGPALSPDGSLIAYQVVITEGVTQLWVASVSEGGAAPHVLVGQDQLPSADASQINSPNHYAWLAGTHTLVFDTRYLPTSGPGGPGEYINADLWKVEADSGALTALLPAKQAGAFAASPNGHTLSVSRATGLDLIDADGSHHHNDLIAFPAIVTYSEYAYKPQAEWSADGSYFTVGIPTQDPMAPNAAITFYKVSADGTVKLLGSHPGNYVFGGSIPPQIAPDGAHVVYTQVDPAGGPEALHMLTIQSNPMGDNAFDSQTGPGGWGWSPDSQVYAYTVVPGSGGGKAYATGPGVESPHTFADSLTALKDLRWVNGNTVVFLGQIGGSAWSLYRQGSGDDPSTVETLIVGLSDQASFDVRP
jgi:WD40-like Beta Propeller Repeat